MSTITAVIHTKNSGATLKRCLDSLQWCDSIMVVDMQSSDETISIAKKYHAVIYEEKPMQFADPIRNQYLHKVKTDWTLIVDSDEEVPQTLATKLRELSLVQGVNGYKVPRANIVFGKWMQHTGFWPDYIVRFFRTGSCTYPPYVHGQPIIEGVTQAIEVKKEFALIHHHYQSIEQYLMRLNVYTSLEVEKKQEHAPPQSSTSFLQAFFDEFYRRFYQQEGYKDGSHGLVVSLLQAIYMMVVMMKRWEAAKKELPISLREMESIVHEACSQTTYWVANEELKRSQNPIEKISLRIRRKVNG